MHIEKLAENKIEVRLSVDDLSDMNIDINALDIKSGDLNGFLFNIMEKIKEETGFNPYGGQVLMEATPLGDDGICILVSKLRGEKKTKSAAGNEKKRITRRQFEHACGVRPARTYYQKEALRSVKKGHVETFYIEAFENLCSALRELDDDALKHSEVYRTGKVYCFLMGYCETLIKSIGILSEFSDRRSYYSLQERHVREHGELIAAGGELVDMARGIRELYS